MEKHVSDNLPRRWNWREPKSTTARWEKITNWFFSWYGDGKCTGNASLHMVDVSMTYTWPSLTGITSLSATINFQCWRWGSGATIDGQNLADDDNLFVRDLYSLVIITYYHLVKFVCKSRPFWEKQKHTLKGTNTSHQTGSSENHRLKFVPTGRGYVIVPSRINQPFWVNDFSRKKMGKWDGHLCREVHDWFPRNLARWRPWSFGNVMYLILYSFTQYFHMWIEDIRVADGWIIIKQCDLKWYFYL